jgi:uncharacterized protein YlxW (UPF0749 family)
MAFVTPILALFGHVFEKYWWQILIALVVGALFLWGKYESHKVKVAKITIVALNKNIATLQGNVDTLQKAINTQNAAVDKAKKASADADAKMLALQSTLADMDKQSADRLAAIKKLPIPQTCEEARSYLETMSLDLSWRK